MPGPSGFNLIQVYSPLLCRPPLYEPAPQVVPRERAASFKEQIALLSFDPYCVTVTLAPGLHGGCLPYIGDTVDFKNLTIFPSKVDGNQKPIAVELGGHIHIDLKDVMIQTPA